MKDNEIFSHQSAGGNAKEFANNPWEYWATTAGNPELGTRKMNISFLNL